MHLATAILQSTLLVEVIVCIAKRIVVRGYRPHSVLVSIQNNVLMY